MIQKALISLGVDHKATNSSSLKDIEMILQATNALYNIQCMKLEVPLLNDLRYLIWSISASAVLNLHNDAVKTTTVPQKPSIHSTITITELQKIYHAGIKFRSSCSASQKPYQADNDGHCETVNPQSYPNIIVTAIGETFQQCQQILHDLYRIPSLIYEHIYSHDKARIPLYDEVMERLNDIDRIHSSSRVNLSEEYPVVRARNMSHYMMKNIDVTISVTNLMQPENPTNGDGDPVHTVNKSVKSSLKSNLEGQRLEQELYCWCQAPYDNTPMIACDHCNEWFHNSCMGIILNRSKQPKANPKRHPFKSITMKRSTKRPHSNEDNSEIKMPSNVNGIASENWHGSTSMEEENKPPSSPSDGISPLCHARSLDIITMKTYQVQKDITALSSGHIDYNEDSFYCIACSELMNRPYKFAWPCRWIS
jgi:hypothetical protein